MPFRCKRCGQRAIEAMGSGVEEQNWGLGSGKGTLCGQMRSTLLEMTQNPLIRTSFLFPSPQADRPRTSMLTAAARSFQGSMESQTARSRPTPGPAAKTPLFAQATRTRLAMIALDHEAITCNRSNRYLRLSTPTYGQSLSATIHPLPSHRALMASRE